MTGRRLLSVAAGSVVVAVLLAAPASAGGTVPGAPRSVTATAGDSQITVTWLPPSSTGGSPITGYQATCGTASTPVGAAIRSAVVTGLTNGTSYACTVTAANANGTGPASSPVNATPAGAPTVPRAVTTTTSGATITTKWKPPANDGGSAVTGYGVTCASTDGGATLSGTAAGSVLKLALPGLPANKTYRCTVSATNAQGTSAAAKASSWAMHVVTTAAAPTARMHVPVTAGKQVTATASGTTFGPNGCADFSTVDPSGTVLYDGCLYGNSDNVLLRERPTTTSGTATVVVASPAGNTGAAELNAYVFDDFTGTVKADGSPTKYSFGYPGQSGTLTFAGTAGQQVSLLYSASTIVQTGTTILRRPDGSQLSYTGEFATSFMDAVTLPVTGTYTIAFDHGYGLGGATFRLFTVPVDTGPIVRQGPQVNVDLDVPGENGTRTFSGTAGQTVTVSYTGSTIGSGEVDLKSPSGTVLAYNYLYNQPGSTFTTATVTLTTTGTYTVLINPSLAYTGSVKVKVTA